MVVGVLAPSPGAGCSVFSELARDIQSHLFVLEGWKMEVIIFAVAQEPSLIVQAAAGAEASDIPLSIEAALTHNDGSETRGLQVVS